MNAQGIAPLLGAAITALAAVALWVATKWWERVQARRLRREKMADVMRALCAEIDAYVYQLTDDDLDAHLADILARIHGGSAAAEPFVPVVPRETHDTVFRAFLTEMHLLPGDVVAPVVLYYNQVIAVANMAGDMGTERFASMSGERMGAMYRHFIAMKKTARGMGVNATTALRAALASGADPAQ